MPLEPESDLHWTAFLYRGGDLPAAEAAAFEARLADDPDARDALAEAVELAEALAIVGPEFASKRRRTLGRRAFVGVATLAAAACLVAAFHSWSRPVSLDASEVAIAWSSLRATVDAVPVVEITEEAEDVVEPSTDRALPSWLLSAASAPLDNEPGLED
jgi:hypothetical protein